MALKRYSRLEPVIFLWFMGPYTFFINLLLFGSCVFQSVAAFFSYFGISILYFTVIYSLFGMVATLIKRRFPGDHELFRRVAILLPIFYVMNLLTVQGVYLVYERFASTECPARRSMEWWVTGYGCLASTLLTFINEAAVGWEKWRMAMAETGKLQSAYQRSRLLSLRRQLHPHFLFNCFNSLSSLIQEDEGEAARFLDELTKVYRYLLKGDEERLVSLEEECRFIDSYLYLVRTRFGAALGVDIGIAATDLRKQVAPMTLLIVLENIIYRNAFSKSDPLSIRIYTAEGRELVIANSLQPKPSAVDGADLEEGLDDLVNKYKLLCQPEVIIEETTARRTLIIPLIENETLL